MYPQKTNNFQNQKPNPAGIAGQIKNFFVDIWKNITEKPTEITLGRKHRPANIIIAIVIALLLFGLILAFSISPALPAEYSVLRQSFFLVLGLIIFFMVAKFVNFNVLVKLSFAIFIVTLLISLIPPILGMIDASFCVNGACRWIWIGSVSFQPTEFLKFGLMIFVASFLMKANAKGNLNKIGKTLLPIMFFTLISLAIVVVAQKDLGSGVALAIIVFIQLIISGMDKKQILSIIAIFGILGVLATVTSPHRMERIETFIGGDQCAINDDESYHICQVLQSLGSGGLFGKGIGQAVGAFGWVPENTSDSIFAIVGESVGYIGAMAVLVAFLILLYRIIRMVDYVENMFLKLFLAGAFGWIFAHLTINIASMTGIIPLTGITLPFISFGGTSIIAIMAVVGVVFAISRYTSHSKIVNNQENGNEDSVRWRGVRRTRYTGSSRR